MSLNAIQQVTDIEQQAKDSIAQATADARSITQEAQQQADLIYSKAMQEAAQRAAEFIGAARSHAESTTQYQIEQARLDCENLRDHAQKNMDTAVSRVVERVVSG